MCFLCLADFFCLSMVCFSSNGTTDKKAVTKIPGKTILLSSIKLKSLFKNPSIYSNKYSIKEQKLLQLNNKKCYFIRLTLNITNISLIDRNIQNSNNGDDGCEDFNNDDGDIDNEAGMTMMMEIIIRMVVMMRNLVIIVVLMMLVMIMMMVVMVKNMMMMMMGKLIIMAVIW